MSLPVEVLVREVLELSPADRVQLLDQVISSLDADEARDARWAALAAERDAEAQGDASVIVAGESAIARVRAKLA